MLTPPLLGLIVALAAGLLIGLERGWAQRNFEPGRRVAGFRTFGLIGLSGGVAGLMPDLLAAVIALGVVGALLIGYQAGIREDRLSATNTITAILTFGLGLAAVRISPVAALVGAGATFMLLSVRRSAHALLRGLTEEEIEGVARFALVALVILPLLPNASYGPYDAWNPRQIWMVVVLVATLSFASYVVARKFGSSRSVLMIAVTGAMVSSTAVTAWYARRLRKEPELRGVLTAGIALASIVMFVRVQVLTAMLVPRALPTLAVVLAPAMLVAALLALIAWRRGDSGESPPVELATRSISGPHCCSPLSSPSSRSQRVGRSTSTATGGSSPSLRSLASWMSMPRCSRSPGCQRMRWTMQRPASSWRHRYSPTRP